MSPITRRLFTLGAAGLAAGTTLAAPREPRAAGRTLLRIGDQTGAVQAKLRAAGLLNDLPYDIEWSVYAAAVNLHEALKAKAVDVGSSADAPAVSAIAGGSKIQIVAGWTNGGRGRYILVPHDSPIQALADLRGKTISPTTRGSVAHFLVLGALKKAGLTANDVKLAFLAPNDASAAFQTGSIDAWGTWAVYAARAMGTLNARVLVDGQGINSGLLVYSAIEEALADPGKVAAIADFAERVQKGYDWSRDNREAYIDFYAGFAKQDRETIARIYEDEATYRRVPVDDALVAEMQKTNDTWVEAGVLSGKRDLGNYVYRGIVIG